MRLAEELTCEYPDVQLYLDLKGVDPQPLSAAQAMAHVVRSYHPEAQLPESEAELAGLYRTILHGKRVLLLMDNAANREQVEPLIPPFDSLLLVTSRSHFALPGLVYRHLDELPLKDARGLLLKIAPRIGKEADQIAQLCGRLPLALRLAGSALAERPNLSPTDYTRRLKEGKEPFGPVEASLTASYELLNADRRHLWRLLAVFPGTFDAQAAVAVWELETDSTSEVLEDLTRSSLVEWEEKDERYRLHDLARSFADRHLEETEREATHRRHAEHYLKLLGAAEELYEQGGESIGRALWLFDSEWSNIQAGFTWASGHFLGAKAAVEICNTYPRAGTLLLGLRQHPRERICWRTLALAAARQLKDQAGELDHLNNLAIAYAAIGELKRAIELHEQELAIACEIKDRGAEGHARGHLGFSYQTLGELRRAIDYYQQYFTIAREVSDRRGEGNALGCLGLAYTALGEPRRAVRYLEQYLAIAHEIGNRRGEGNAFGSLGLAYTDLGEQYRAAGFYEQEIRIALEIGDRQSEAAGTWLLGLEIEKEGDLALAAELMQVRVDYEREIGHPDAEEHAAEVATLRARIAEQGS